MLTEELDSIDTALLEEASKIIKLLNKALDNFEMTLLSRPYDTDGAVVNISAGAGAGGTDAQVSICSVVSFVSIMTCVAKKCDLVKLTF
jgi:ABC-type transporter Mla subunit MlaD